MRCTGRIQISRLLGAAAALLLWAGCGTGEIGSGGEYVTDGPTGVSIVDGGLGPQTGTDPAVSDRVSGGCVITGCDDQLCSDSLVETACQESAQAACFSGATCGRGESGACSWQVTSELNRCLAQASQAAPPRATGGRGTGSGLGATANTPGGTSSGGGTSDGDRRGGNGGGDCVKTGSFGELCSDQTQETPAQWLNVYACYWSAACERQSDGRCGWTSDDGLNLCVEIARAFQI